MNYPRRKFLKSALSASAAPFLLPTKLLVNQSTTLDRVGIITNTIRNELASDYRLVLETIADIGYQFMESSFVPEESSAASYHQYLQSLGLSTVATGVGMRNLENGELDTFLKKAEALDARYLVCYYPWLTSAENLTAEEVLATTDRINKYGKQIKDAGFRFAWHNHDKEFVNIDGKLAFDTMMEHTDSAYSTVELDWYWVVKGGQNPVSLFNKYPGRFELAHVKDMNNNRDQGITCVGNGIIDFKPIFEHAEQGGVKHFIVENERAVKGIKCARESYHHISNIQQ